MESHIKNYFDQPNTQNEIKDSTQAINFNFDKANQNLKPSGYPNNDNQAANVLEETPQFDDRQMVSLDKNIIKGCVVQDYETTKVIIYNHHFFFRRVIYLANVERE